jgi:hypothetical protein
MKKKGATQGAFMNRSLYAIVVAALVFMNTACNSGPSSTSANAFQPRNAPAAVVADKVDSEAKVTVPVGTKLRVVLLEPVSSDRSHSGDSFLASLAEPVVVDGKTFFPKGTKIRGHIVDAKESGRVKGLASLKLTLTEIVRDEGEFINISTRPYTAVAESTTKRDVAIVGGGTGVGAAIGAIAGGKKGAVIGAGVGAGAGTGTVLATKGKEVRFAAEHPLSFTLARSIQI